jgi:hypothetical protein
MPIAFVGYSRKSIFLQSVKLTIENTYTANLTALQYTSAYNIHNMVGPGWRSRYSDSLRAGRSGDRIPVGARFSAPVQTGPRAHPVSYTMGTGSFPWVKRPGRGVDHQPPSRAEVKERVELYLYCPSGPSWPVPG